MPWLVLDDLNVCAADALQELHGRLAVELGVSSFDRQEEAVVGDAMDGAVSEDRVVQARQSVEGEHAEHCAEAGQQNHHLERDRDGRWPRVWLLAGHPDRVVVGVHPPHH